MLNDTSSLLAFLQTRKSASAKAMGGPGPSDEQVAAMLNIAMRIPDHGKLAPWRFILFQGEGRETVGKAFRARWAEKNPTHGEDILGFVERMFSRAPVVVAVVSKAAEHPKIPVWEQQMSAGAVCYNLVLAAQACGFDAQWQTDWLAYDEKALEVMGVLPNEKVAGLIYIGTSTAPLEDRPRPEVSAHLSVWGA